MYERYKNERGRENVNDKNRKRRSEGTQAADKFLLREDRQKSS
jgi:hypothetical protein